MTHQEEDNEDEYAIVVVKDEGVLGIVLEQGAHVSKVLYCVGGLLFEEIMENEDFEVMEVF